jgi:hypothetical protein
MIVKFNKNIYPMAAVEQAIKDWQSFAKFRIISKKNNFLVEIGNKPRKIADEFINYVLSAIKNYPEINGKVR